MHCIILSLNNAHYCDKTIASFVDGIISICSKTKGNLKPAFFQEKCRKI